MAVKIVCDFCDRPLKTEIVDGVEVIKHYHTKECDTRALFPHLCEDCAAKIDSAVAKFKDDTLEQIDISIRNNRINAARRELLGTRG